MDNLLSAFISWPWLALLPALLLATLYLRRRRRLIAVSAGLWLVYFFYERAIKSGLACSGDCNIRVDLLLIYPLLGVVSIIAIVVGIRSASSK